MSTARSTLGWFRAWGRAAHFTVQVTAAAISKQTYSPETRAVVLRQIYYTAWQVLAGYLVFSLALSYVMTQVVISVARGYGLDAFALDMVLRVLVLEILPLGTALLVALRSGSAISTEVALMRATGELDRMREENVDPMQREFVPRVLASALSVLSLTVLSCAAALFIAYVVTYGFSPWGFEDYTRDVAIVFDVPVMVGFTLKCITFGIAVAVIPISAGIDATKDFKSAPIAVMGGMVRLVLALGVIEMISLAIKYV